MQEQNKVSIDYFKVKERFADLINGFVYHGKQAVREEDIVELDPVLPVSVRQGQAVAFHGNVNIVDLMRQVRVKCHVVLVALQNQSEIHYAMPVRVMSTDAANYYSQWKEVRRGHREGGDLTGNAEFLSGMKKGEKLEPVFTMVAYFGKESWDGPRTLREMLDLSGLDKEIQKMIADYPMNLLEVRSWENLEWFHSDIREVFGFLKYAQDKRELKQFVEENKEAFSAMSEEAYDFLGAMSRTKELKELKREIRNEGGRYNMCKAIDDMVQDGVREGRDIGIKEGIVLAQKLIQDNRQEELLRSTTDPELQRKLMEEYALDV